MDKDRSNEQLSPITIDSSIHPDDANEIDFDVTRSIASIVTQEGYTPSSASIRAGSDIEHRYELIGNINIINQM